jgi:hypothetical protein
MKYECLITILELLANVQVGNVMDPDFKNRVKKLNELKEEAEIELQNLNVNNSKNTSS